MIDSILKLLRGSVRPVALFVILGGITFLAVYHGVTADTAEGVAMLMGIGGPIVTLWFVERKRPTFDEALEERDSEQALRATVLEKSEGRD